jgi:hypothetical protein
LDNKSSDLERNKFANWDRHDGRLPFENFESNQTLLDGTGEDMKISSSSLKDATANASNQNEINHLFAAIEEKKDAAPGLKLTVYHQNNAQLFTALSAALADPISFSNLLSYQMPGSPSILSIAGTDKKGFWRLVTHGIDDPMNPSSSTLYEKRANFLINNTESNETLSKNIAVDIFLRSAADYHIQYQVGEADASPSIPE